MMKKKKKNKGWNFYSSVCNTWTCKLNCLIKLSAESACDLMEIENLAAERDDFVLCVQLTFSLTYTTDVSLNYKHTA